MLSAAPLFIGAVYIEEDFGSDYHGDTIEISFQGGAPGTELKQLVIDGDQIETGNPTGFSLGDVFFDTADGGFGADAWFEQNAVSNVGIDFVDVDNAVVDGSTRMVLNFSGFQAGDKLILEVDVDEVLDFNPAETDLKKINDGFDPITSGREFRNSQLYAFLTAPHYENIEGNTLFVNEYDPLLAGTNLDLTPDDGAVDIQREEESIRDRTAGAMLSLQQTPLPVTIAGTVFEEINLDLVQDPGEPGISGVTLSLYKEDANGDFVFTQQTAVTDGNGDYLFGNDRELMPGVYQVREGAVPGYFDVGAIPGEVDGTPTGSTVSGDPNILTEINIPLGDTDAVDYDFAESLPAEISGYVYHDRNMNGLRDAGEQGIGQVEIQVVPVNTIAPQRTVSVRTDGNGFYRATGLAPGAYRVVEPAQPAPYWDWLDVAGTVEGVPSGAAVNPGDEVGGIFLGGGQSGIEYDFGEILPGSIAGVVRMAGREGNCDHQGVNGGKPIEGATVKLQDARGNELKEVQTDSDGRYRFDDLLPGTYTVVEITPAGLIDGEDHVGLIDGVPIGSILQNDVIGDVRVGSGQTGEAYDFCEHDPATLSGYVYHDRDNDGLRAPGDEGIADVEVVLRDVDGNPLETAYTNGQGYYQFTQLAAGDYVITESHPQPWTDGIDTPGLIDGLTMGVADDPGDRLFAIRLQEGNDGIEYNFGELLPGAIAGVVRMAGREGNCDHQGVNGGKPIEGATVKLQDARGNELKEVQTDSDGRYRFDDLLPGTYTVVEITPAGLIDGEDHVGLIDGVPIGSILQNDVIGDIRVRSGQTGEAYDFCEHDPATLSGYVYHDRDNDGLRAPGDEGIADVEVVLRDVDGNPLETAYTNGQGYYQFTQLAAGDYVITESHPQPWTDGIDTPGLIDGLTMGVADDPGDRLFAIRLQEGNDGIEYNFGELLPGAIAGVVRMAGREGNCDHQGINGGKPIEGATVKLQDARGNELKEVQTDSDGRYRFDDLLPGTYTVVEITPAGLIDGEDHVGLIDGVPLGSILQNDVIGDIRVRSGQSGEAYDFCEHDPAMLSGYVYHDRNNDGYRGGGEEGIGAVMLSLLDDGGNTITTALTDPAGYYEFTDLAAGTYEIVESHPSGWIDGLDTAGTILGLVVGAADLHPGDAIRQIVIREGETGIEYDFGEFKPAGIAGLVHVDPNRNGIYDDGEDPIAGVTVELLDASGTVAATTTTNSQGRYRFDVLSPGIYTVREIQPEGYFQGGQRVGSGDGDASVEDVISTITIASEDRLIDYDFAEVPPVAISGYVFQDGPPILVLGEGPDITSLRDGVLTPDDTRLPGVTLELRHGITGVPIDAGQALPGTYPDGPIRTVTDANGYYQFTGLRWGNYAVYEIQPKGYVDGIDTPGTQSGIAFNPGESINPAIAGMLLYEPNNDAIIRIVLYAGNSSAMNNFSELATFPALPPEIELPPIEWFTPELPNIVEPSLPFIPYLPPVINRDLGYGAGPMTGNTWHLSVIDAGQPRGEGQLFDDDGPVWLTGSQLSTVTWNDRLIQQGSWQLEGDAPGSSMNRLFGLAGAIAVAGDFNGDGVSEIGVFYKGEWFIDLNANGRWDREDLWAKLGHDGDLPVTGDWDGDGKDDIGIFGPAWFRDPRAIERDPGLPDPDNMLATRPKNIPPEPEDATVGSRVMKLTSAGHLRADLIDHVFHFGVAGDVPVTGDWNGDGIHAIGVFRHGRWNLDVDGDGRWSDADAYVEFGRAGDVPVVGDFNGDGVDDLGVYRAGKWYLDTNGNRELDAHDKVFELGGVDDQPVVGDWSGDGIDQPGIYSDTTSRVATRPSE